MLIQRVSFWHIIIVALGVYAVMQISIEPITWDSAVAVGLFLVATIPPLVIWVVKKNRKGRIFEPVYQLSDTGTAITHKAEATEDIQHFQLTLKMIMETHVEFVALMFDGQGTLPLIHKLYDWQRDKKDRPHYVNTEKVKERFYWRYDFPEHRLKGSRITIGCEYKAKEYFEGYMIIQLTCTDGFKEQKLPFKITKISD